MDSITPYLIIGLWLLDKAMMYAIFRFELQRRLGRKREREGQDEN